MDLKDDVKFEFINQVRKFSFDLMSKINWLEKNSNTRLQGSKRYEPLFLVET